MRDGQQGAGARAFARSVLGQDRIFEGLRRVLPVLARAGVEVMPLKGALLAWVLYERPEDRPLSDADLLVRPRDFDRAAATLVSAGGRAIPRTAVRKVPIEFHEHGSWWTIDLHCELWEPGFVALDVPEAWRQAKRWESPYGVGLSIAPRTFTFAHCAAHFARNAYTQADAPRAREIGRLLEWTLGEVDRSALVTSLARAGAAPSAYYALAAAAETSPPARQLLGRLPLDRTRAFVLRRAACASRVRVHPRALRPLLRA